MNLPNRLFRFIIFSNLFIAICAVLMCFQTSQLLLDARVNSELLLFVFFATVCSYSFHWMLTAPLISGDESVTRFDRNNWLGRHLNLHVGFFLMGAAGSAWFGARLMDDWPWLLLIAFITFLYSAPKIPLRPFRWLRKIALGKTIFLALVWTLVTTWLPVMVAGMAWKLSFTVFLMGRFFLIYAICILFDLRDREYDRSNGIRSLTTWLSLPGVRILFYLSILLSAALFTSMLAFGQSGLTVFLLLIPVFLTMVLFKKSQTDYSDLLYYLVLDGLMALSPLLTLLAAGFPGKIV